MKFWKKPMQLEENVDYKFVESDDGKVTGVGFLKGKYAGVLYHYGKARVVEDEGFAKLQFSYVIDFPGQHDPDELTNDPEFHTIMGDLLTKILSAQIQDEKTRNYNSEEFDI
jgi:hypothetical protein